MMTDADMIVTAMIVMGFAIGICTGYLIHKTKVADWLKYNKEVAELYHAQLE